MDHRSLRIPSEYKSVVRKGERKVVVTTCNLITRIVPQQLTTGSLQGRKTSCFLASSLIGAASLPSLGSRFKDVLLDEALGAK